MTRADVDELVAKALSGNQEALEHLLAHAWSGGWAMAIVRLRDYGKLHLNFSVSEIADMIAEDEATWDETQRLPRP